MFAWAMYIKYGPWNDECLEIVCGLTNIIFIEGNHERIFLGNEDIHHEIPLVQEFYANSIKSFSRIDLIKNLKCSHQLNNFLCTHTIENKSIYPDSKLTVTQNYILGHTHHQFQINSGQFLIINPSKHSCRTENG